MARQNARELHHVIPCSLPLGMNYHENLIDITQSEHLKVHELLDVSNKTIRSFRLRTNHLMIKPNEYYVREVMKLHQLYFARLPMLPERLQKLHAESMRATALRYRLENGFQPVNDTQHGTWSHMFNHWLGVLHDTLLELVK